MDRSVRHLVESFVEADSAWVELCCRHLEDDLVSGEHEALAQHMAGNASARRVYVVVSLLSQEIRTRLSKRLAIHAVQGDVEHAAPTQAAKRESSPASSAPINSPGRKPKQGWTRPWHFAAAAALLVATVAVALYFRSGDTEPTEPSQPRAPIATLIETSGATSVIGGGDLAYEGQQYAAGLYTLDAGSAKFLLTNQVGVELRGKTSLELRGNLRADLVEGEVAVACPPGVTGYTVVLPDGSQVVDLGTRFVATVDNDGGASVRVTEGSVRLTHRGTGRSQIINEGMRITFDPEAIGAPARDPLSGGAPLFAIDFDQNEIDPQWKAIGDVAPLRSGSIGAEGLAANGGHVMLLGDKTRQEIELLIDLGPDCLLRAAGLIDADGLVGTDDTKVYVSWIARGSERTAAGWGGINFYRHDAVTCFTGRPFGQALLALAVWRPDPLVVPIPAGPLAAGSSDSPPRRFVVEFDFADDADRVSVWIDPNTQLKRPLAPDAKTTLTDARFNRLILTAGGGSGDWAFDDFKIGSSWRSVMPSSTEPPQDIVRPTTQPLTSHTPVSPKEGTQ